MFSTCSTTTRSFADTTPRFVARATSHARTGFSTSGVAPGKPRARQRAARVTGACDGRALGIDRSEAMIEQARVLTREQGPQNVSFACADVETYAFPARELDIAISRFGSMFFADPTTAFSNICCALKPLAPLVMIVWQTRERNEWSVEIPRALAGGEVSSLVSQAFSLGDRSAAKHTLNAAGFVDVAFDEVHEPVFYGTDIESAFAFVSQFLLVQEALKTMNDNDRKRAQDRLRALLEKHLTPDGVWFDARAWIVSARSQEK
jgi:ubiquinone/menaquinone biosynthesis C-methylase UbiE